MPNHRKTTVLQLVSYAAGREGRRGVGGPERRALESLERFDPDRVHLVVCYSRAGRLRTAFERMAARLSHVELVDFACLGRRDVRAFDAIRRLIVQHDVDVVHTQGPHGTDWWASAAAYATRRPIIITRPVTNESYELGRFDAWRFARLDRLALSRAHAVVFVSRATRDQAIRSPLEWCRGARTIVIPNGVDIARFAPRPTARHRRRFRSDVPTFGMIGQLLPVKNWDGFLEIAQQVRARIPDVQALIAGDGPERERLTGEIRRRGLQRHVRFVGHLDDVAPFLRELDVFTLCSHREGLPVSLLEAMASGVPAVVTDVGANDEVVLDEGTGFVVPDGDMGRAADRVVALLSSPRLRARMALASLRRARDHYALDRMVERYQQLYEEAAGRRFTLRGRRAPDRARRSRRAMAAH